MQHIVDVEGNQYRYLTMGKLQWTIDNFKCKCYSNGDPIFHALGDQEYL